MEEEVDPILAQLNSELNQEEDPILAQLNGEVKKKDLPSLKDQLLPSGKDPDILLQNAQRSSQSTSSTSQSGSEVEQPSSFPLSNKYAKALDLFLEQNKQEYSKVDSIRGEAWVKARQADLQKNGYSPEDIALILDKEIPIKQKELTDNTNKMLLDSYNKKLRELSELSEKERVKKLNAGFFESAGKRAANVAVNTLPGAMASSQAMNMPSSIEEIRNAPAEGGVNDNAGSPDVAEWRFQLDRIVGDFNAPIDEMIKKSYNRKTSSMLEQVLNIENLAYLGKKAFKKIGLMEDDKMESSWGFGDQWNDAEREVPAVIHQALVNTKREIGDIQDPKIKEQVFNKYFNEAIAAKRAEKFAEVQGQQEESRALLYNVPLTWEDAKAADNKAGYVGGAIGMGVGSSALGIAASAVSGPGAVLAMAPQMISMYQMESAEAYDKYVKAKAEELTKRYGTEVTPKDVITSGQDRDAAEMASNIGKVNSVLEQVGFTFGAGKLATSIFKKKVIEHAIKKGAARQLVDMATGIGTAAGAETATEVSQTISTIIGQAIIDGKSIDEAVAGVTEEDLNEIIESGRQGGIGGAFFGGLGSVGSAFQQRDVNKLYDAISAMDDKRLSELSPLIKGETKEERVKSAVEAVVNGDIKRSQIIDFESRERLLATTKNVKKAFKRIAPDTKVEFYSGDTEGRKILADLGEEERDLNGFYHKGTNTIYVNQDMFESNTGIHEGFHPIINALRETSPDRYAQFAEEASAMEHPVMKGKTYGEVMASKTEAVTKDEALVEYLADIADGKFNESLTLKEKAIKFVNSILETVGLGDYAIGMDVDTSTLKSLAEGLASAVRQGRAVNKTAFKPTEPGATKTEPAPAEPAAPAEEVVATPVAEEVITPEVTPTVSKTETVVEPITEQAPERIAETPAKTPKEIAKEKVDALVATGDLAYDGKSVKMITPKGAEEFKKIYEERKAAEEALKEGVQTQQPKETGVLVAPYYDTTISNTSDASKLRQSEGYKTHIKAINEVANSLGIKIKSIDDTIGGFVNQKGKKIREISNRVVLDTDNLDDAAKFAAMIGALTTETQEATIAGRYVDIGSPDQVALETRFKVSDLDKSLDLLEGSGINDYTASETGGHIDILDFSNGQDADFNKKAVNFKSALESNNIKYEQEHRAIESRYIDPEERTRILEGFQADERLNRPGVRSLYEKAQARNQEFLGSRVQTQERKSDPGLNPNFINNAVKFANESSFANKVEFKEALQDRFKSHLKELQAAYGKKLKPSEMNALTAAYATDILTEEAKEAIKKHPEAIGWYAEKTQNALAVVSALHPEIATDETSRNAFIMALAITSNGNKVNENFSYAEKQYQKWKESGRFETDGQYGLQQIGIKASFNLINKILDRGVDINQLADFLKTEMKAGDLSYKVGGKKKNIASGELVDEPVNAAVIFGSKIGDGFLLNLWGRFDKLTMDRWFMRTWGRVTGTLLDRDPAKISKARQRTDAAITATLNSKSASAILKDVIGSTKGSVKDISKRVVKASMDKDLRAALESNPITSELRKASNGYQKILAGEIETPGNGQRRRFIRNVFKDVQKNLKLDGINIDMADLQAVLWYPEKKLYESFKEGESFESYEEGSAPDYQNAAVKLVKSKGITDEQIERTIRERGAGDLARATRNRGVDGSGTGRVSGPDGRTNQTEATKEKVIDAIASSEAQAQEPKLRRINRTAARVQNDITDNYQLLKGAIQNDPDTYMYNIRSINEMNERITGMDDATLSNFVNSNINNLTDGFAAVAAVDLIRRLEAKGQDSSWLFKELWKVGSNSGFLVRVMGELKTSTAEGLTNVIRGNVKATGSDIKQEDQDIIKKLAGEYLADVKAEEEARREYLGLGPGEGPGLGVGQGPGLGAGKGPGQGGGQSSQGAGTTGVTGSGTTGVTGSGTTGKSGSGTGSGTTGKQGSGTTGKSGSGTGTGAAKGKGSTGALKKLNKATAKRQQSQAKLTQKAAALTPRGLDKLLLALLQGNTLGIPSVMANIIGNTVGAPARWLEDIGGSAFVQTMNAMRGHKTTSADPRLLFSPMLRGFGGLGNGIVKGSKALLKGSQSANKLTDDRSLHPYDSLVQLISRKGLPVDPVTGKVAWSTDLEKLIEGTMGWNAELMFRLLEFTDAPFRESRRKKAEFLVAIDNGAKTIKEAEMFIASMNKDQKKQVDRIAEAGVFADDRTLSDSIKYLTDAINRVIDRINSNLPEQFSLAKNVLGAITKVTARTPFLFIKIPANLTQLMLELRFPGLAFAGSAKYSAMAAFNKSNPDKAKADMRKAGELFTRGVVGWSLNIALDSMLAAGLLSAGTDDDKPDEKAAKYSGAPPNSFNYSAFLRYYNGLDYSAQPNDHYINFARMGQLGMFMAVKAEEWEMNGKKPHKDDQAFMDATISNIYPFMKGISQAPFMEGAANIMNAMSGENGMKYYASQTLGTLTNIPTFGMFWLSHTNNYATYVKTQAPYILKAQDRESVIGSIQEKLSVRKNPLIEDNIAGVVPARNIWGEKVPMTPEGSNPWVYHFLDIRKGQTITDFWSIENYKQMKEHPNSVPPITAPSNKVNYVAEKTEEEVLYKVGGGYTIPDVYYDMIQAYAGKLKKQTLIDMYPDAELAKFEAEKGPVKWRIMREVNDAVNQAAAAVLQQKIYQDVEAGKLIPDNEGKTFKQVVPQPYSEQAVEEIMNATLPEDDSQE